ncbi:ParA family partition ATPase [Spirosoma terrae]|uniref:ParA family protein n=1 Tax=Spirosoma terrae TaxID=1968276 RepID=A0A6L9LCP0_9BACT|nr:ParA family protein [Spirosoma terrae]NDU96871.1 ParA family protein [Spirosoma terrae]
MKVITIAHQKGGVGKTTLAINLAYCFAEDAKVAIVDTDLQGSVSDLKEFLSGVDIVDLELLLSNKLSDYDLVVVDTPPYLSNRLSELFALSDYVLVPTKAGILDAMAIRATIALLQQSMSLKPTLKAGIVLNMVLSRTSLTEEVKEILTEYAIPLHTTAISQRVSYTRSPMTNSVFGSEDQRAKDEVIDLAGEILDRMNAS